MFTGHFFAACTEKEGCTPSKLGPNGPHRGTKNDNKNNDIKEKLGFKKNLYLYISATALARLACKGVLLPLAFCLWLWCLVFFFDFSVLGGPGFRASGCRALGPPPKSLFFQ